MATGTEILSYRGNSGLGNNSDIPAIGTKDLEVVNNTLDRLQAQNSMRNQQIFQQRVKDRDALLAELDSGQIKVGDLLEQDMPTVKEGLQKLDEAYYKRIKKGINDIDAAREYKQALRDAQDRVTQAQARKFGYDALNGDIAKETLPRKQEAMKSHLDKTINGGFWKDLTPYQQTQDLDVAGSILSTAATEKQQYTDKNNPLLKGTRTLFDYDKTFLNNKDNFLNDANKRYDQQQLVGAIQSLPPQEFLDTMQAVNNRIKEYNDLKGVAAGQPGFVKDVQFAINPNTGQAIINENVPDFAAKYTLAHQKPFSSAETELDKAALELEKLKIDREQIKAANYREKLQQNGANYRANLPYEKMKLSASTDPAKEFGNIIYGVNSPEVVFADSNKRLTYGDKTRPKIVNGAIVADNGVVDVSVSGDIKVPFSSLNNTIITEFNKYSGQTKLNAAGEVVSSPSTSQIKPDKDGNVTLRFDKGVISGIKTTDAASTEDKPIDGTFADVDQFQYITTQSSQKGATKYKKPEDISGGLKQPVKNSKGKYPLPKGNPQQVQQNGVTYEWDSDTGEYQ